MKKSGSITVFTSLFCSLSAGLSGTLQSVQIGGGRVQAETGVKKVCTRYLPGMTGNCWKDIIAMLQDAPAEQETT